MRREVEYRRLLEKAQEATLHIDTLLAALQKDPRADSGTTARVERISETLRALEHELDQLWDEFKRM